MVADVIEGIVFAAFRKHAQQKFELRECLGMDEPEVADSLFEILVRRLIGISVSEAVAAAAPWMFLQMGAATGLRSGYW